MMTSAIHYPSARILDLATMKRAMLLWDRYKVIVPYKGFHLGHLGEIAEAWSLIGGEIIPTSSDKARAHEQISQFIRHRSRLNPQFFYGTPRNIDRVDRHVPEMYEVFPQKFLGKTWDELEQVGMTTAQSEANERPMTEWGGLVVMAKLADACAGSTFARVTDRRDAYRAIASESFINGTRVEITERTDEAMVLPVLLSLVDASDVPLAKLIAYRAEEKDPFLRHNMLATISKHIIGLRKTTNLAQIRERQEAFEHAMKVDLFRLRDELRSNKVKFVTSTAVLTGIVGAFAVASALTHGAVQIGAGLVAAGTAGARMKDFSELFGSGLDLADKQRKLLELHPMAYMHEITT